MIKSLPVQSLAKTVGFLLLAVVASAAQYQTGKLLAITDARSNREVENSYNGSIVTVTDVEYRFSVQIGR